jgi:hypothetical protein
MFDNIIRDSSYTRLLVRDGRVQEVRRVLRLQGDVRFGAPDEETAKAIEAIEDIDRLERLSVRLLTATGWADLLASDGIVTES